MKLRYFFLLSLLIVGLLSACNSNMNDYGRDVTNNENANDRTGTQQINDRTNVNTNRNPYNTTRVRFEEANNGRDVTNTPINDTTNRRMANDATRDDTRQGRFANDNQRTRNYVENTGDLNGFNEPRMRVADRAADRVAALKEIDSANVIVTDNNAYVAAKLDDSVNNELTSQIERKISERVKSADRDIDNVYVSINPDFYDRTTNYAQDIRQGRPVSGFFNEFTETIRRVFPNNVQQ